MPFLCTSTYRTGDSLFVYGSAFAIQEFVYPEGVSLPIGGVGKAEYVVLEMHYDNPNETVGTYKTTAVYILVAKDINYVNVRNYCTPHAYMCTHTRRCG